MKRAMIVAGLTCLAACHSGDSGKPSLPPVTMVSPDSANHQMARFSPDGKRLAIAGGTAGMEIAFYEVETGKQILSFRAHSNWTKQLAYSADGRLLVSSSVDKTVAVWNAMSGLKVATLSGHTGYIDAVAISQDGTIVASLSWDLTLKLWNPMTGAVLNTLTGHTTWGRTMIAFSPDGARVALVRSKVFQDMLLRGVVVGHGEGHDLFQRQPRNREPAEAHTEDDQI